MKSLFQIGDELSALAELMNETGGEIPEGAIGEELEAYFDSLHEEKDRKLEAYCWLIKEFEARAECRQQEAYRIGVMASQDAANAKRLKDRLKGFLETQDPMKSETRSFKVWVQKNSATPIHYPEEWDIEPATAPEAFQRRVIALDKDAIRDAIKAGDETHGARLGERGSHLRIK